MGFLGSKVSLLLAGLWVAASLSVTARAATDDIANKSAKASNSKPKPDEAQAQKHERPTDASLYVGSENSKTSAQNPSNSKPAGPQASSAQEAAKAPPKSPDGDYVGSETCITCHDDQTRRFKNTVMGKVMLGNPHTPEEARGCESCHGPGRAHVEAGGGKENIPIRFGKDSKNSVAEQNSVCMDCHSRGTHMFWKGSPHESRGIACVDCHQVKQEIHTTLSSDARYSAPLSDNRGVKKSQPELCLQCHQMRRAQLQRSSHMPYREGKVTCTSCHNPHGTPNPKQLIQSSTNENCLSCHTERRGPFLWEHPPVLENCANCHEPHGSNNPQLLKVRMPRVCDDCHDSSRHPTQAQPLSSIKNFNRGCTNCHSHIHGSNHPSGSAFLR